MISEKRFSLSHSAFWNSLLPMEEPYIRTRNVRLCRFAAPLYSLVPPDQRGLVNECAFLLFAASLRLSVPVPDLPENLISQCASEALAYIAKMPHSSGLPPQPMGKYGLREAATVAKSLSAFFSGRPIRNLLAKPSFPGCGWLDEAVGDVLGDYTLFEVKAGERQFRGADIRQLLCYCALNFSIKKYDIKTVCLVNPRSGIYLEDDLETLCMTTAGMTAAVVLSEIVNYIAEPFSRYRTG